MKLNIFRTVGKPLVVIGVIASLAMAGMSARANIVVDGDFSTLAPWNPTGPVALGTYDSMAVALLGTGGTISQPLTLTGGLPYLLTFWAAVAPPNTGGGLFISLDDAAGVLLTSPPLTSVLTKYTFTLTPTSSGPLVFTYADNTSVAAIGDITLNAVPEPTTVIAGLLLLLPLGISAMKILRKNQFA